METPAKIYLSAHCSDSFNAFFYDANGEKIAEFEGYVPAWLEDGSDDLSLEIDTATGKVIGWERMFTPAKFHAWAQQHESQIS